MSGLTKAIQHEGVGLREYQGRFIPVPDWQATFKHDYVADTFFLLFGRQPATAERLQELARWMGWCARHDT
ncbi:MAG: hypothetical protein K9L68_13030 [Spirochaetales bacterium]|nr:hypothetical protein [Spirochaetales bacterium]